MPRLDTKGNPSSEFLRGRGRAAVERFLAAVEDPEEAQAAALERVLASTRGTEVGERFGLARVATLAELQSAAPVRDFEAHRADLTRVWEGERGVVTREQVLSFVASSGTTAAAKRLPITASRAAAAQAAQQVWLMAMVREQEAVAGGASLTVVGAAREGRSPGGLVLGSNTGRLQQSQSWWVRRRMAVPSWVHGLSDPDLRTYVLLRLALTKPVTSLTTANPSTVLALCRALEAHREALSQDLADGTLCCGPAAALSWSDRLRAGWLGRRVLGPGGLGTQWPLATVNCWKGGAAGFFVERLGAALGADVPVREVGIAASEGFVAVPLHSSWSGGVAWSCGHLLELVADGVAIAPHQASLGGRYRVVLSTTAGLLRYDLDDYVDVVGFYGRLPILRFVGKGSEVSSLTGEKLTAQQLAAAMAEAAPLAFGFAARAVLDDPPGYRFVVEGVAPSASALDAALRRQNGEWASKRDSDRLRLPTVVAARPGAFEALRRRRLAEGAAEGQVKDPVFVDQALFDELVGGST